MILPKRRKAPKMAVQDLGPIRCPGHLTWIRGHVCTIAGRAGHVCEGRIEAAHVRTGTDGGTAMKPGDNWSLPLCSGAHREQHEIGEAEFERRYSIDMKAVAFALWRKSPHRIKFELERSA